MSDWRQAQTAFGAKVFGPVCYGIFSGFFWERAEANLSGQGDAISEVSLGGTYPSRRAYRLGL